MGNAVINESSQQTQYGSVIRNLGGDTNITTISLDGGAVAAAHQLSADAIDANTAVFSENLAFAGDTLGKAMANTSDVTEYAFDFLGRAGEQQERMFDRTLAAISGQASKASGDIATAYQTARTSETADLVKTSLYGALGLAALVAVVLFLKR